MSTSSAILDNWEDGIHYCGDIDDLIDALYEESEQHYVILDVLEKYFPDLSSSILDEITANIIIALEDMNADSYGD